jgi:hypothetical protein
MQDVIERAEHRVGEALVDWNTFSPETEGNALGKLRTLANSVLQMVKDTRGVRADIGVSTHDGRRREEIILNWRRDEYNFNGLHFPAMETRIHMTELLANPDRLREILRRTHYGN